MKREFCTLFDSQYLTRAVAMHESMTRHVGDFHLTAFCFDDEALELMRALGLEHVTAVALADLEAADPELAAVRPTRSPVEYCWTATPALPAYLFAIRPELREVTYIDADLLFFSDPEPLFEELWEGSVLITPHRFPPELEYLAVGGIYNVQFVTFRRGEGENVLAWWRERCLEWCYNRLEDGKLGDQKYLDDWPTRFAGIHELAHLGGGVAPWNVQQYRLDAGPRVEGVAAVFYHYHGLKLRRSGRHAWRIHPYALSRRVRRLFYEPYFEQLELALARVRAVRPDFDHGFAEEPPRGLARLLRRGAAG